MDYKVEPPVLELFISISQSGLIYIFKRNSPNCLFLPLEYCVLLAFLRNNVVKTDL